LSLQLKARLDRRRRDESAVQAMGDEKLRVIAHELLESLRKNVTVDWAKRESARANMRVLVKRILKKYGYPPDLAEEAVQTVLAQAEALLQEL
jgi:type I restriction enzyme R subunit